VVGRGVHVARGFCHASLNLPLFDVPVSTKVVFMDGGHVIKAGDPRQTFDQPQQAHTREFVEKILRH